MMWCAGGKVRGVVVFVKGRAKAGRVVGIASRVDLDVGGAKMSARETLRRCEGVGSR